jgi:hypothetical protein
VFAADAPQERGPKEVKDWAVDLRGGRALGSHGSCALEGCLGLIFSAQRQGGERNDQVIFWPSVDCASLGHEGGGPCGVSIEQHERARFERPRCITEVA